MTAFVGSEPVRSGLWKRLIDAEPETTTAKPRAGGFQEVGTLPESQDALVVVSEPGRLTLQLQAPAARAGAEPLPILQRTMADASQLLAQCLLKLAEEIAVNRLAFGAVLVLAAADAREAHSALAPFLVNAVRLDTESATDFLYRINRPRQSRAISGLRLNRLSTWSVMSVVNVPLVGANINLGALQTVFASRLELDINTDAAKSERLPGDQLAALWAELVAHAEDIAAKGDVP